MAGSIDGGVTIHRVVLKRSFHRDYGDLTRDQQETVDRKIQDLLKNPRPPGLRFEKLKCRANPSLFTIHITGNYKLSVEVEGDCAILRHVGNHDTIDRVP